MKQERIDILLATHNGEIFLETLVASVMAQGDRDFRLRVFDDGSTDATVGVLENLQRGYPGRLEIVQRAEKARGPVFAYSRLLQRSNADYVMFCDQDDVWRTDKVARSMQRMERLEAVHGRNTPILIHTDLAVVDANLKTIDSSFAVQQRLDPRRVEINRLLVKNVVTGCTVTINRALRRLLGDIPSEARMHDWWIALVASLFGVIDYIAKPTVQYRQHSTNAVGAGPINPKTILRRARQLPNLRNDLEGTFLQAGVLLSRYGDRMSACDRRLCQTFVSLPDNSAGVRMTRAVANRFFSHGWWRNLGWMLILSGMLGRLPRIPYAD